MGNDLLALEAPSITTGFRILNTLTNVKLLDAEPVAGGRFLILARGTKDELRSHLKEAFDAEVIESIEESVLEATFSLASNKIDETLVVVETETAVALLAVSHVMVKRHGVRALEIKIRKTGVGGGYAYFTGALEQCETAAADARTHLSLKMRKGVVEVIDHPTEIVRGLFGD